jgi:hypothetical protein
MCGELRSLYEAGIAVNLSETTERTLCSHVSVVWRRTVHLATQTWGSLDNENHACMTLLSLVFGAPEILMTRQRTTKLIWLHIKAILKGRESWERENIQCWKTCHCRTARTTLYHFPHVGFQVQGAEHPRHNPDRPEAETLSDRDLQGVPTEQLRTVGGRLSG